MEVGSINLGLAQICVCLTLIKILDSSAGKMRKQTVNIHEV